MSGRYPAILDDPKKGDAARKLFADGQALLERIVDEKLLERARDLRVLPGGDRRGDEIVVYTPDNKREAGRFPMLRQQEDKDVCLSLADFIAPQGNETRDHLGAFIVTAGLGTDELAREVRGGPRRLQLRSWRRPSPTGSPRPRAEYLHARVRARVGLRRDGEPDARRRSLGERATAASGRRSAIRRARTTRRRARCSSCSTTRTTTA